MVTSVTGVTQQQQVLPVPPATHLAHSLHLRSLAASLGLCRLDWAVPLLTGGQSVAVVNPRELQPVYGTGLGQLQEKDVDSGGQRTEDRPLTVDHCVMQERQNRCWQHSGRPTGCSLNLSRQTGHRSASSSPPLLLLSTSSWSLSSGSDMSGKGWAF